MKFEVLPDPVSPNPRDFYRIDPAGRGSTQCLAQVFNADNIEIASAIVGPSDPISVALCSTPAPGEMVPMPEIGCDEDGISFLSLPGATDACWELKVNNGPAISTARRVTFTPINPTIPFAPIEECLITGRSLEYIEISKIHVTLADTTPTPCPADFNNSGAVDLNDLLDYVEAWTPAAGTSVPPNTPVDFNNSLFVDLNDLLDYVEAWTPAAGTTCP